MLTSIAALTGKSSARSSNPETHSLARPPALGGVRGRRATLTEGARAQDGEGVRCRAPLLQEVYAFVSTAYTQTRTQRAQRALPSYGTTHIESLYSPARHIYAEFSHRFSSHLYSYLSQRQKFNAQGTAWS
ncbi:unnamed protein product [Leuciscus chuanchicus]